eukprot:g5355.t1
MTTKACAAAAKGEECVYGNSAAAAKGEECAYGNTCRFSHRFADLQRYRGWLSNNGHMTGVCPEIREEYRNSTHVGSGDGGGTTGANSIPVGKGNGWQQKQNMVAPQHEELVGNVPRSMTMATGVNKQRKVYPCGFRMQEVADGEYATLLEPKTEGELRVPRIVVEKVLDVPEGKKQPLGALCLCSMDAVFILQEICLRVTTKEDALELFRVVQKMPARVNLQTKEEAKKTTVDDETNSVKSLLMNLTNQLGTMKSGTIPGGGGGQTGTSMNRGRMGGFATEIRVNDMRGLSPGTRPQPETAATKENYNASLLVKKVDKTTKRKHEDAAQRYNGGQYTDPRSDDKAALEEKYQYVFHALKSLLHNNRAANARPRKEMIAKALIDAAKDAGKDVEQVATSVIENCDLLIESFKVSEDVATAQKIDLKFKSLSVLDLITTTGMGEAIYDINREKYEEEERKERLTASKGKGKSNKRRDDSRERQESDEEDDISDLEFVTDGGNRTRDRQTGAGGLPYDVMGRKHSRLNSEGAGRNNDCYYGDRDGFDCGGAGGDLNFQGSANFGKRGCSSGGMNSGAAGSYGRSRYGRHGDDDFFGDVENDVEMGDISDMGGAYRDGHGGGSSSSSSTNYRMGNMDSSMLNRRRTQGGEGKWSGYF